MKKMILAACITACTVSASAQDFTVKSLISKATSSETIQKVKDLLETPRVLSIIDELNEDLSFNIQKNKAVVSSKDNFSYFKVNGQVLPKNASVKLEAFGIGVKISKKGDTFTIIAL